MGVLPPFVSTHLVCAVPEEARREHQFLWNWDYRQLWAISWHVGIGNWIHVLWKSRQCSQLQSHLLSPKSSLFKLRCIFCLCSHLKYIPTCWKLLQARHGSKIFLALILSRKTFLRFLVIFLLSNSGVSLSVLLIKFWDFIMHGFTVVAILLPQSFMCWNTRSRQTVKPQLVILSVEFLAIVCPAFPDL